MVSKENLAILLTACIKPDGMSFTVLQNAEIRYQQYLEAIEFYLKKTDFKIVFIDNSGVDVSDRFTGSITSGRLEVLCFNGNNYNKDLGKSYGEMLIIEHALEHSSIIQSSAYILKITGRHKVLNVNSIVRQAQQIPGLDILANLRNMLSFPDSSCWLGSIESFRLLIGFKELVNDSQKVYFEHMLLKTIHSRIEQGMRFCLIKNYIRYQGMSGTSGSVYNHSWIYWFWKNMRSVLRYYLLR